MTGENMVDESAAMAQTYDAVRNPHPTPPHTPSPALTLKGEGAVCGWVGVGWVGGWVGRWGVGGGGQTSRSVAHPRLTASRTLGRRSPLPPVRQVNPDPNPDLTLTLTRSTLPCRCTRGGRPIRSSSKRLK
jgi:hypothetical protein